MTDIPSPNFDERPEHLPIDMLVIHYTGMPTAEAALERMCDPASKVSAHYMIHEDGTVVPLVAELCRAWHAGVSFWRGETDINGRSIGIELANPGHEFGYRSFPEAQMAALIDLAQRILKRHPIPARNVVGHSDIAPRRKEDPGELFDWKRLADEGIGIWPTGKLRQGERENPAKEAESLLTAIGYETVDLEKSIVAFQRRYRPRQIDGAPDLETLDLLAELVGTIKEKPPDRPVVRGHFSPIEADAEAIHRNGFVDRTSDANLLLELKPDLQNLKVRQASPFRFITRLFMGSRDFNHQRLTGLEYLRLLRMAGRPLRDDVNPDGMVWISLEHFAALMEKAEARLDQENAI